MSKFLTPGVIVGLLALAAGLSEAAGYPAAAAVIRDPATASFVTSVASAALGALAGGLAGVVKA